MNSIQGLIANLRSKGIRLALDDEGRLRVRGDEAALDPDLIENIKAHREQILAALKKRQRFALLTPEERSRLTDEYEEAYPLSAVQAGMVFHTQLEQFSGVYHDIVSQHVKLPWDESRFAQALSSIVEEHPPLRTGFRLDGDRPLQLVYAKRSLPLYVEDLRALPADAQEARLSQWMEARKRHVFDWEQGPLFAIHIFLRSDESFQFALSFHHAVMDGWSRASLTTALHGRYEKLLAGASLGSLKTNWTYREFIELEQQALNDPAARSFFVSMLADAPTDQFPRRANPGAGTASRDRLHTRWRVPGFEEVSGKILGMARQLGVPVQAALLAGHFKVLSVLSGKARAVSNVVHNGRPERKEAEGAIGVFLNSMPVCIDLQARESWRQLIERTARLGADCMQYRSYPLSRIQQDVKLVFGEVLFNYTHFHVFEGISGASREAFRSMGPGSDFERSNFDVSVDFLRSISDEAMSLAIGYDGEMFDEQMIRRVGGYYVRAFEAMVADLEALHNTCSLLSDEERHQLQSWNATDFPYPVELGLHELIEAQVWETPDAPAVSFEGKSLTYQELNAKANRLAHCLRRKGVGADIRVALCLERSLEMVVSILAVLKAGGAYVPIEPTYPEERLAYLLKDCGASIVLTHSPVHRRLPVWEGERLLVDTMGEELVAYPDHNPDRADTGFLPNHLAYVIYTSGSTGKPKGAMNEHAAVVNRLLWARDEYRINHTDRVLQKTPYSFDVSVWELLLPLLSGAHLVMARPGGHLDPEYVANVIDRERITTLHFVPSMLQVFLEHPESFRCRRARRVLCSGEALPYALQMRFLGALPAVELHNLYGPTEAAIDVTSWRCRAGVHEGIVPIGRPIANTQIHILDEQGQPVPQGVAGELYIGGAGVARGYLNRPDLTQQRFITDRFSARSGAQLYRTGDLARWLPDGAIEYLGRNDFQVKIRGFRIELGEIEEQLLRLEGVRAATVLAREDAPGQKRLVAYVVAAGSEPGQEDIARYRSALSARLPEYMVPSAFVLLGAMPLSSNGKVDRKLLPAPEGGNAGPEYVAPRSAVEKTLCEMWASLLRVERVGVEDNFFSLGGDSILAMQFVARASRAGLHITTQQLFTFQTVAQLSRNIPEAGAAPQQQPVAGAADLLPVQIAFLEEDERSQNHFNQAVLLDAPAGLEAGVLSALVRALYERHDALRLRFGRAEDQWRAAHAVLSDEMVAQSAIVEVFRSDGPADSTAGAWSSWVTGRCEHYQKSLDIAHGPLFRAVYLQGGTDARLFLVAHHMVVDGVSWRVLLADLRQGFEQSTRNEPIRLARKTSSYQEWARALAQEAHSEATQGELEYWLSQWNGDEETAVRDRRDTREATAGATLFALIRLDENETTALLRECNAAYDTTINELLLSGVYLGLRQWTGSSAQRIHLEGHGRESLLPNLDITDTVGWFTTVFPVRLYSDSDRLESIVPSVRGALRAIPRSGIGYGLLRHMLRQPALVCAEEEHEVPLVFNYLGQLDQVAGELGAFAIAREGSGSPVDAARRRRHRLALNGMVSNGVLQFRLEFSAVHYRAGEIQVLAQAIESALRAVIQHCRSIRGGAGGERSFEPFTEQTRRAVRGVIESIYAGQAPERTAPVEAVESGVI